MDTEILTSQRVWDRLMAEPEFSAEITEQTSSTWQQFCNQMCFLAKTLQGGLVDARSFVLLKREIVLALIEGWNNGLFETCVVNELNTSQTHGLVELCLQDEFLRLCDVLDRISVSPPWEAFDDEAFFADEKAAGFSGETLQRWRQGDMTVGDLMLMQPSALLFIN